VPYFTERVSSGADTVAAVTVTLGALCDDKYCVNRTTAKRRGTCRLNFLRLTLLEGHHRYAMLTYCHCYLFLFLFHKLCLYVRICSVCICKCSVVACV
jgi:hypothetical protein